MKPIDMHVHIIGVGAGGTGCRMRTGGWRTPVEQIVFHHIGLQSDALSKNFDQLYAERLLQFVCESSLGAAVLLAMDHVRDERGEVMEKEEFFYVPNSYVLNLAKRHAEFLPAVSIHPARPDALEELDRCLDAGAAMMKLLPNYQNVNCSEPRYRKFWERMAEAGLPLLSHTGGEYTVPNHFPKYADPRLLKLPLQCGVTVVAAHSAARSGLFDPDYLPVLVEMMTRFPNLYADNSAFNIPLRSKAFRASLRAPLAARTVHGSDFPVLVYAHWAWMRGLIDFKTFRRCQKERNVLERDYQIKCAIGYPDEVFTRVTGLLRKTN